ncbi:MAG: hypothetical protein KH170_06370, partial [Lachnospiraceae bacterium oral taxon 082]|nr:hypothetical protein [Lachnospiraceae bacterium oral taxon 082]
NEQEITCPSVVRAVTRIELNKYVPNGCDFHAFIKFSKCHCEGKNFGGKAIASASVLNAEKTI